MNNEHAFQSITNHATDYYHTSIELLKLQTIDKSSDMIATLVSKLLIAFMALLFIVLASVGISIWLGVFLHSYTLGFLSVALFYLLVTVLLTVFQRKWLFVPLREKIISYLLKEKK